jgi:hypothetical protein
VAKTEKAPGPALTLDVTRDRIVGYKMRFFATDGDVEHHKGTKNKIADRLGAFNSFTG